MTTKLNWKLKQLPTASEVADLVSRKIITASEAKQMLFTETEENEPTIAELKRQIEFLEGLVKELSKRSDNTYVYKWIQTRTPTLPNVVWCSSSSLGGGSMTSGTLSGATYAQNLLN